MAYTNEDKILSQENIKFISGGISFLIAIVMGFIEYKTAMSSAQRIFSSNSPMYYAGEAIGTALFYWGVLFVCIYVGLYVIKIVYFIFINPIIKMFVAVSKKKNDIQFKLERKKELEAKKEKEEFIKQSLNGLRKEFNLKYFDLKNKYLSKLEQINNIVKPKLINYKNNNLEKILLMTENRNVKSVEMTINKNICYIPSTKYVEYYTNEGKKKSFDKQIKIIKDKFGELNSYTISKYYKDYMKINKCLYLDKHLEKLKFKQENKYNDIIDEYCSYLKNRIGMYYDVEKYITNRTKYLYNGYKTASIGVEGEENVSKELKKYEDEFINIESKTFDLSLIDFINADYKMECDNILITRYGVFVLETKNKGKYSVKKDPETGKLFSDYEIQVENDGRWVTKYSDGGIEVWERNPVVQNRDHIIKLRKIINTRLNIDEDDEDYIDVKGIIVIANNEVKINKQLKNIKVCRVSAIYEEITEGERDSKMTKARMKEIEDIINSYSPDEHKADTFGTINVKRELDNLTKSIDEYCNHEGRDVLDEIEEIIEDFKKEHYELDSEYNKLKSAIEC